MYRDDNGNPVTEQEMDDWYDQQHAAYRRTRVTFQCECCGEEFPVAKLAEGIELIDICLGCAMSEQATPLPVLDGNETERLPVEPMRVVVEGRLR
jgi:hypothetical protein